MAYYFGFKLDSSCMFSSSAEGPATLASSLITVVRDSCELVVLKVSTFITHGL